MRAAAMTLSLPPQTFHLTNVVRAFLAEQEWNDEVTVDGFTSQVSANVPIHEQAFRLYIDVNESTQLFSVLLYSPINVSPARLSEVLLFLNKANYDSTVGKFSVEDDGDP